MSEGNQEQQKQNQQSQGGGPRRCHRAGGSGRPRSAGDCRAGGGPGEPGGGGPRAGQPEPFSETTNEAGQTVQRTVDETGSVVENT